MSSSIGWGRQSREQRRHRWRIVSECAADLLGTVAARRGELAPTTVTRIVLSLLPRRVAAAIEGQFRARGWMRDDAVVPAEAADVFGDHPRAPLLRLALLGLPGQGQPYREKHRMDVYQRLCAEIMTLGVDSASLERIASRALNHPDVNADSLLASMLHSFIAERRAALQSARITAQGAGEAEPPVAAPAPRPPQRPRRFVDVPSVADLPTRDEVLDTFSRLRREFEAFVQQFEEPKAVHTLDKLRLLRQRFPVHIPAVDLQTCEEQFDSFRKRCATYRRQIDDLAQRGATAALAGDHETGAWVVRRLEAIHRLLPMLLPSDHLDRLRSEIMLRASEHERYQATQQIRQRKHEVITQIRELAAVVHHFHQISQHAQMGDPEYDRAEMTYREALETIRSLNTDWLTGLVLELETLLEELDDPSGEHHNQLDRFILNVRTALNRLCLEIRAHQQAQLMVPPADAAPEQRPIERFPA